MVKQGSREGRVWPYGACTACCAACELEEGEHRDSSSAVLCGSLLFWLSSVSPFFPTLGVPRREIVSLASSHLSSLTLGQAPSRQVRGRHFVRTPLHKRICFNSRLVYHEAWILGPRARQHRWACCWQLLRRRWHPAGIQLALAKFVPAFAAVLFLLRTGSTGPIAFGGTEHRSSPAPIPASPVFSNPVGARCPHGVPPPRTLPHRLGTALHSATPSYRP